MNGYILHNNPDPIKDERIIRALLKLNKRHRSEIIKFLGNCGADDEFIISIFLELLKSGYSSDSVAYILGEKYFNDERIISAFLTKMDEENNYSAVGNFLLFGPGNVRFAPKLGEGWIYKLGLIRMVLEDFVALHIKDERIAQAYIQAVKRRDPSYITTSQARVGCYDIEGTLKAQFSNLAENVNTSEPLNDVLIEEEEDEGFILIQGNDETKSTLIIDEHIVSTAAAISEERHTPLQRIVEDEEEINIVSPIALVAESSNELTVSELIPKGRFLENKNNFFQRPGCPIKVGVGTLPTDGPPDLFSIVERGDLTQLVKDLSKKDVVNVFARNKEGNSALGIAAKKGHLAVLDHLIRHYYVPSGFDDKEKQALQSSEHLAIRHYLDLFEACSRTSAYAKVLQLLDKAVEELGEEERSFIYLMYLWTQVHHRIQRLSPETGVAHNEHQMHQLQRSQKMELTHYMIQEGHVLNDWAINAEELVIRELTLDKPQVDALTQLLENSAYEFSLLVPGGLIEPNKIYFKLNGQALQYRVRTCSGTVVTAEIDCNLLKCNLSNPFSLEQLAFVPDLLKIISDRRGHIRAIINTLTFDKVHFTREGYESFLNTLKNPLLVPWLQTLKLTHCQLNDEQIQKLSAYLINRSELIHLELDNNNITYPGLDDLLDVLNSGKSFVKLNTLSLCFNYIEIKSKDNLDNLIRNGSEMKIKLQGNMITDNNANGFNNKKEYKNRLNALLSLFYHISKQAPHLTINDFLRSINLSFVRHQNESDNFLRLTLNDLATIDFTIPWQLFDFYNQLFPIQELSQYFRGHEVEDRAQRIFSYLKADINEKKIPDELRYSLLPQDKHQQHVCKGLLNYHPDARLKSHLITHSLLCSSRANSVPSYLFPEIELTLQHGNVYFFSSKEKTHSMLGYEYLTGYGQRVLMVVHLEYNETRSQMTVSMYRRGNLASLIKTLHRKFDIGCIRAEVKGLKSMRDFLEKALIKEIVGGKYQTAIAPSSRKEDIDNEKQIHNCVTYCIDRINKNSLGFKLNVSDYWLLRPGSIVNAIKNNPESIIKYDNPMLQMK